jgi:DNA-binding response OmpR family regulator
MATILITGDDFAAVNPVRGVAEGLAFTILHAYTTENVVEDAVLNGVALVIVGESSRPFDGWEVCAMLRADPAIPADLPILLMHGGDVNERRFEKAGFSGKIAANAPAALWTEEIVRQMGERASNASVNPRVRSRPK